VSSIFDGHAPILTPEFMAALPTSTYVILIPSGEPFILMPSGPGPNVAVLLSMIVDTSMQRLCRATKPHTKPAHQPARCAPASWLASKEGGGSGVNPSQRGEDAAAPTGRPTDAS
jgi:hypothetical protein